jgi:hypothetical protein
VKRRAYLASIGGIGLAAVAGSTEQAETDAGGTDPGETTTEPSQTTAATTTESATESTTGESTTAGETEGATYQVRVTHDGQWSGSIATGDSSRTIDGSGTETIDVEGDPSIITVNAQKHDDGAPS